MAHQVTVGLRIPATPAADLDALRPFVGEAEALGFYSIWVGDHVFHSVDVYHPLLLLTWVAAQTTRVRLGTAVLLSAYRNPVLLAKAAATLDRLSSGRLLLALSMGGTDAEYLALGVPKTQRVARLKETFEVLRRLWTQDKVTYEGRFYRLQDVALNPTPVQRPCVPLWMGGAHENALRRAAELADGWVATSLADTQDFVGKVAQVRRFAQERGRDPDSLGFGKLLSISLAQDRDAARRQALMHLDPYYGGGFNVDRFCVFGTAEECATGVKAYTDVDAASVTMVLEPPTLDLEHPKRLADAVLPLATA